MGNESSSQKENEVVKLKVQFLGNCLDDKASLFDGFVRKMHHKAASSNNNTIRIETLPIQFFKSMQMSVTLADYGMADVLHGAAALSRSHFSAVDAAIVVFDARDRSSFSFAKYLLTCLIKLKNSYELPEDWIQTESLWDQENLYYFNKRTKELTKFPPDGYTPAISTSLVLVGNNSGDEQQRIVSIEAHALAKNYLIPFFETRSGSLFPTSREISKISKVVLTGLFAARSNKMESKIKKSSLKNERIQSLYLSPPFRLKRSYSFENLIKKRDDEHEDSPSRCSDGEYRANCSADLSLFHKTNHLNNPNVRFLLVHSIVPPNKSRFSFPLEVFCAICKRRMFGHRIGLSCGRCGKVICRRSRCGEAFVQISFCENQQSLRVKSAMELFREGLASLKYRHQNELIEWMLTFQDLLKEIPLPLREDESFNQTLKDLRRESVLVNDVLVWANPKLLKQRIIAMLKIKCLINNSFVRIRLANEIMKACCRTIAGADSFQVLQQLFDHPDFDIRPENKNLPPITIDLMNTIKKNDNEESEVVVDIRIFSHFDIYQPFVNMEKPQEWLKLAITIQERINFTTKAISRVLYINKKQ